MIPPSSPLSVFSVISVVKNLNNSIGIKGSFEQT